MISFACSKQNCWSSDTKQCDYCIRRSKLRFQNGRKKVERQIYQNFELALAKN